MTLDDLIAQARETVRICAKSTPGPFAVHRFDHDDGRFQFQIQQDRKPGRIIADSVEVDDPNARNTTAAIAHVLTAAPTMAAALVAIGPALVEWREAKRSRQKAGMGRAFTNEQEFVEKTYAADVRLDAADKALAAALDTLNAAPAAGKG